MPVRSLRVFLQSIGLLMAAGFQIYINFWSLLFRQRIELLLFDITTFRVAMIETILGIMSGFLIAVSISPYPTQKIGSKIPDIVITLSILLPTIALILKGIAAATGFRWFPIRFMPVWNWAIYSDAPALWLGVTLAALIPALISTRDQSN